MTYDDQCATGRAHAAQAIQEYQQTGNAPKLVRAIRAAAADDSGFGAGFLFYTVANTKVSGTETHQVTVIR